MTPAIFGILVVVLNTMSYIAALPFPISPASKPFAVDRMQQEFRAWNAEIAYESVGDWTCNLTAHHPVPVIMLPGLLSPGTLLTRFMARQFKDAGYCVYQLEYGLGVYDSLVGMTDMRNSSQELELFVTRVLATTGANKVDILAHSEGTLVTMWYLKYQKGTRHVRNFVGIAPLFRGTNLHGLIWLLKGLGFFDTIAALVSEFCEACTQMAEGSEYLQELHRGGEVPPTKMPASPSHNASLPPPLLLLPDHPPTSLALGTKYLMIMSRRDEFVTPYTSGYLDDEDVRHVEIEDICSGVTGFLSHLSVMFSPVVFAVVDSFLTPQDARPSLNCHST